MTVKELIEFLSKQNPEAKITLTKSECHVFDDGYDDPDCRGESWYEDNVTFSAKPIFDGLAPFSIKEANKIRNSSVQQAWV